MLNISLRKNRKDEVKGIEFSKLDENEHQGFNIWNILTKKQFHKRLKEKETIKYKDKLSRLYFAIDLQELRKEKIEFANLQEKLKKLQKLSIIKNKLIELRQKEHRFLKKMQDQLISEYKSTKDFYAVDIEETKENFIIKILAKQERERNFWIVRTLKVNKNFRKEMYANEDNRETN